MSKQPLHRPAALVPRRVTIRILHEATKAGSWEYLLPLGFFITLALFFYFLYLALYRDRYQTKEVIEAQIAAFHWIDPRTDVNAAARELAGRYLIEATYLLVLVTSLAGDVCSIVIFWSMFRRLTAQHFIVIPILAAISFIVSYMIFVSSWDPFWTASLTGNLTEAASARANFKMFDQLSSWAVELTILSQSLSGVAISVLIAVAPRNPKEMKEKASAQALLLYINPLLLALFRGWLRAKCSLRHPHFVQMSAILS